MSQVLVRGVSEAVLRRLKARAKAHGRSLQAELKAILESAAPDRLAFIRLSAELRDRLADRPRRDSARLLHEEREGR